MNKWVQKQSGFTIVELLIVIVVIGILAAITIMAYNGVQDRAHASTAQSDASNLVRLLGAANALNGSYPADLSTVNSGAPMPSGDGTTYAYHPGSGNASYCATVTNGKSSFKVSDTATAPVSGGCPGDGQGGVAAITNLITNPSVEANLTDISGSHATITRDASWASNGSYSIAVTPSDSGTDSFAAVGGPQGGMRLGMQAGKTYTLSAVLHIPTALTGTLYAGRELRITAWQNAGGYSFTSATAPNSPGTYPLKLTFTLPSTATEAFIRLYNGGSLGAGTVYFDSVMLTEGSTAYSYADGNSSNWIWNGTTNNATSTGPPL